MKRELAALVALGVVVAAPVVAQSPTQEPGGQATTAQASPAPAKTTEEEPKQDEKIRIEETLTVTASKVETKVIDAPATMSVVTGETIDTSPAQNYGDLLRSVPGMNVIQTSARDVNLTTRQATSTLNNSQLVLVDGRSVYLDFFGLVLWDFVPNPASGDIKQIEVVRGPASVVWGANALSGVVNIITRSPREHEGFGLNLSAGMFNRDGGSREADGAGYQYNGNFSYASALNSRWSYKLTAGYFSSDAYSRPVGRIPLGCHPLGVDPCRDSNGNALPGGYPVGGASYPADSRDQKGGWVNNGTSQPKVDFRLDQEVSGGGRITYEGGYAGTDGIIHTGIGPFDIQSGSYMAFGQAVYTKNALRVGAFGNFVDANAPNLLQIDPHTLQSVVLGFKTQTYDLEVGNSTVLGRKHVLTYGGNFRRNNFDITIAPQSEDRNEFGAYLQEEFFVRKFRLAAGGRVDKFGNLDHWVFSPRVSVMFKPTPDHSIRASYNRAFRAPSVINNYLDQDIIYYGTTVDLRPLGALVPALKPLIPQEPFFLDVNTFGNPDLKEEHVDAIELAYTGTFGGKTTVGLAVYQNDTNENTNFTYLLPTQENPKGLPGLEFYSVQNPAQGIGAASGQPIVDPLTGTLGLNPILMDALARVPPAYGGPILLPYKVATYLNLGPIRNRGLEASIAHRVNQQWMLSGNYSWQHTPEVLDPAPGQIRFPVAEVTVPAANRFNLEASYDGSRLLGNVSVSYSGKAFWNDVLNEPYAGYTAAYTLLNATVGVRLADGKATVSLRGTNLLDKDVLQHIYGDLMKRSLVAELRFFTK